MTPLAYQKLHWAAKILDFSMDVTINIVKIINSTVNILSGLRRFNLHLKSYSTDIYEEL